MKKKLLLVANDINKYLIFFLRKQNNSGLLKAMKYGLLPGGKKNDKIKNFSRCW